MIRSLLGKAIVPVDITVTGFVVVCCLVLYSVMKRDKTAGSVNQATALVLTLSWIVGGSGACGDVYRVPI